MCKKRDVTCCSQVLATVQTSERTGESEESRSPGHVSSWMLSGTPETPSNWSKVQCSVPGLMSSCLRASAVFLC